MECRDARRLIDRHVLPGTTSPKRVELGFHLAGCAECRDYRAQYLQRDTLLLDELLFGRPSQPQPPPRTSARRLAFYAGAAVLIALALWLALPFGRTALALLAIRNNFQAMQIDAAQPSATPTAVAVVARPTGAPPSPTPTRPPLPTPLPPSPTPEPGPAFNVLLMGVDSRPSVGGPARTDAIMIAHVDTTEQRVALLSLPRDLIVPIPGIGYDRINAASVYGEMYPELGGGIELTRRTISDLLGLPIDYVVRVDFNGFIGAIDAIGGVTINVEKEIYDPQYPTMDYGYMVAHFLPGEQHMDGATALIYSRVRHGDSDFERMKRQQSVVLAAVQGLRGQGTLDQIQALASISTALRGYVYTDIPEDRVAGLLWAFRNFKPSSVERYTLDGSMVAMYVSPDDPYAEYAVPGALEALVAQLLTGPITQTPEAGSQ